MTLQYDPVSPLSRRVPAALDTADALATAAGFLRLLDSGLTAAEHIGVGAVQDPWSEDEAATVEDLESLLLMAYVEPPDDEPLDASPSLEPAGCPREAFSLLVRLRRQAREAELDDGKRNSFYLAVWDCADSIPYDLVEALQSKWNDVQASSTYPMWSSGVNAESQGAHLTWDVLVSFGGSAGDS